LEIGEKVNYLNNALNPLKVGSVNAMRKTGSTQNIDELRIRNLLMRLRNLLSLGKLSDQGLQLVVRVLERRSAEKAYHEICW
jgi:hypothetical protein